MQKRSITPEGMKAFAAIFLTAFVLTIGKAEDGVLPSPTVPIPSEQKTDAASLFSKIQPNLFTNDKPLEDDVATMAARAKIPCESKGRCFSSFRVYNSADCNVFGIQPFMVSLYGNPDKVAEIDFVFINDGDFFGKLGRINGRLTPQAQATINKQWQPFLSEMRRQEGTLEKNMGNLLGTSTRSTLGMGKASERVTRWDKDDVSVLLSVQNERFVALRIRPKIFIDNRGLMTKVADEQLRDRYKANVVTRPNGDEVITEIPMVNQGWKDYSLPATFERALRYMGMSMDMYLLAMFGNQGEGGGVSTIGFVGGGRGGWRMVRGFEEFDITHTQATEETLSPLLQRNGLQIRTNISLSMQEIKHWIRLGIPLIWRSHFISEIEQVSNDQTKIRATMPLEKWTSEVRKYSKRADLPKTPGVVRLIIGCNEKTREIAYSDPLGETYAERWITIDTADKVSISDRLSAISW